MRESLGYKQALKLARKLRRAERSRLIDALVLPRLSKSNSKKRSILELQGLGKEIWNGMDAQEYVRRERASWVG